MDLEADGTPIITSILIVAGSPDATSTDLTRALARTHDVTIACDGGLRLLADAGLTPDIVVGDLDSATPEDLRAVRLAGASVLVFPVEKDETDLDLALEHARYISGSAGWVPRVTLTGTHGGRLDHELAILGSCVRAHDLSPVIVEEGSVSRFITPEDGRTLITQPLERLPGSADHDPIGMTVSLIALGEPGVLSTTGLRWDLAQDTFAPLDSWGVSNIIEDAGATLDVHSGVFMLHLLTGITGTQEPA